LHCQHEIHTDDTWHGDDCFHSRDFKPGEAGDVIARKTTAQACAAPRKKGFTLTEIAIVLGIIGIILAAVWSAASRVYLSTNATKFEEQIGQYLVAVRNYCTANLCAPGSTIPTVTVSLPTLPAATASTATVDATGSAFDITYTYPANKQNTCMAMTTGINAITGAAAATTAALADSSLTIPVASSGAGCSGAGTTPGCPAATATMQYVAVPNSCTSAVLTSGFCVPQYIPSGICTTSGGMFGAAFSLSFY
jgi:prepilin-type N-terminal cleavage/methylation domain-containing protein